MVRPPYGRCPAAAAIAVALSFVGATANAQQILLLDFWSPSCGPCMQMKPIVHSFEQAGYPIRQVDTTRDAQLSHQYNVTQIPCFVMLVDGREVERQIGATSSENLQQMFERAKDEVRRTTGVRSQSPDRLSPAQNASPERSVAVGPSQQPGEQAWPPQNAPNAANNNPSSSASSFAKAETPQPLESQALASDFPSTLLAARVRLRVEDGQGNSCGTGTIIDSRSGEALVITCGHLFRDSKGKGPIKVELFQAAPAGVQVVEQVPGQLIRYDLTRDLAFVSIRTTRQINVAPVAPPRTAIGRSDRVASVGCSNGKDPTIMASRITTLDRYQGPPNIEATGAPVEGRSGGGLFNLQGQLIGVCYAADYEGNEGLYAALESVHEELDRLGLSDIYAKSEGARPNAETADATGVTAGPSVVRGQELPTTPIPNNSATPPGAIAANATQTKQGTQHNLSETEQAALEEIMSRAVTSEVVCIIRPKEAGAQSEVITLDNVSPDFVRALAERKRNAQAPVTR